MTQAGCLGKVLHIRTLPSISRSVKLMRTIAIEPLGIDKP